MYKRLQTVDNLQDIVDNAAELFVELYFFEELTATPSAAAAGHLQAAAAAGLPSP